MTTAYKLQQIINRKIKGLPSKVPAIVSIMIEDKYLVPIQPYVCEHCEQVMTITGELPPQNCQISWRYWIYVQLDERDDQPLRKVKHISDNGVGDMCTECYEFYNDDDNSE
jgi:hypothetical protein